MLIALYIVARLLVVLAVAMVPPAFIAFAEGAGALAGTFVMMSLLLAFASGLLVFALRDIDRRMRRSEALLVAAAVWFGFPVFATPPFAVDGLSTLDAYFQAVSAFTTTGASVLPVLGVTPQAILFWQATLQWLGGFATLLTIVLLIVPTGAGGLPTSLMRLVDHVAPSAASRLGKVIRAILPLYLGMTVLCILALVAAGVPAFEAMCVAFATVSTGGLSPVAGGVSSLGSVWVLPVLTLFMIYGATSVLWHRMLLSGDGRLLVRHRESYVLMALCLLLGLAYTSATMGAGQSGVRTLLEGIAMATSVVTTTGFEPRVGLISSVPVVPVLLLAVIGGGTFSTAGGLKLHRVGAMMVQSFRELRQLVYPHGVLSRRLSTYRHEPDRIGAVWSLFAAFVLSLAVCAAIVAWTHPSPVGALTVSLAAVVNNGPLYSLSWPAAIDWPTYGQLAPSAKTALIATMVLGRVELISLLGLMLAAWRRS